MDRAKHTPSTDVDRSALSITKELQLYRGIGERGVISTSSITAAHVERARRGSLCRCPGKHRDRLTRAYHGGIAESETLSRRNSVAFSRPSPPDDTMVVGHYVYRVADESRRRGRGRRRRQRRRRFRKQTETSSRARVCRCPGD